MSAFPPVTTDIYLPALPELTHSLRGTITEGQVTLAVYFVGLGLGQLFYGPWSDRIGRRPTMLVGATIYFVASVGCALSTTMNEMIALRFFQAIGACSGVVISTAVVRDRFNHQESARIFSMLLTLRGVGPIVAPLAGGVIVTWLGWRAIFWAVTLFGVTLGLSVFFGLAESRTAAVATRARAESPIDAYTAVLNGGGSDSRRRRVGAVWRESVFGCRTHDGGGGVVVATAGFGDGCGDHGLCGWSTGVSATVVENGGVPRSGSQGLAAR
jgi:DHA1 family bicyclomycin/chloramphenicol resistance-like MFS transporter